MPIYEYRCQVCHHQDSFLESLSASKNKTCPKCGKRQGFKRLISAAGFQLKGSGWYVTDFKNKPEKNTANKSTEIEKKEAKDTSKQPVSESEKKSDKKEDTSKK